MGLYLTDKTPVIKKIEAKLCQASMESNINRLLWAQWSFDKEILSSSLNSVSTIAPHYSLHDSSHSLSIIREIEKILGDYIDRLSYIDCWLFLEAAFWHDMGMIISDQEKREYVKSEKFRPFLNELIRTGNDLTSYAQIVYDHVEKGETPNLVDLEMAFRYVIAEYVRKIHPTRSKKLLADPDQLAIASPNTGLIPKRLFIILGNIIESHGKPFSAVLDLPFENDGIEVHDKAYPRFVASLLRLGDLLDLDDHRHSSTQLMVAGKIPALSSAHKRKHQTIVSKNISSVEISIEAKCLDIESFELQSDWFSWIEEELANQDKYWSQIAPSHYLSKLPGIKTLQCELDGSVSLGQSGARFAMDSNRIYSYLTGELLYGDKFAGISELLQNAVDATIERIWLEHRETIQNNRDTYKEIVQKYPINIEVKNKKIEDGRVEYIVSIKDLGKGMTLDDIKSITTIASQKNFNNKQQIREEMPDWMRPSGMFGIGLQSVFELTDELNFKTQAVGDSGYEITIKLSKTKMPSIVVRRIPASYQLGTTVSFSIFDDAVPNTIYGSEKSFERWKQFDPLKEDILSILEAHIEQKVESFSINNEFMFIYNKKELSDNKQKFEIVDVKNGIEYSIHFCLDLGRSQWAYRGRKIGNVILLRNCRVYGNIMFGRADNFLTIDRKELHQEGKNELFFNENSIFDTSIIENREKILSLMSNEEKPYANLFYLYKNQCVDDSWKSIPLLCGKTIGELIEIGSEFWISENSMGSFTWEIDEKDSIPRVSSDLENAFNIMEVLRIQGRGIHILDARFFKYKREKSYSDGEESYLFFKVSIVETSKQSKIDSLLLVFPNLNRMSRQQSIRHFLPISGSYRSKLGIPISEFLKRYYWIDSILPRIFTPFFDYCIPLRLTNCSLEEDLPTLVKTIKIFREDLNEADILQSLREFYKEYPFEFAEEIVN